MTDQTAFLKPAPGLKVRDPRTGKHIPEAGDELPLTRYVRRRLKAGDLVGATRPAKQTARPARAEKSES